MAGCLLALELQSQGIPFILVDNPEDNISSSVAAGIYNPLTGRKVQETWMAGELFEFLNNFYPAIENRADNKFFHPRDLVRVFPNPKAANDWDSGKESLLAGNRIHQLPSYLKADLGGIEVLKAGFLDIKTFIHEVRKMIPDSSILLGQKIDPKDIGLNSSGLSWNNIQANKLIFCEGPRGSSNQFFSWLPFSLTKGEILEVDPLMDLELTIYIKGIFLLPISQRRILVGATYEREPDSHEPSEKGKQTLIEKFEAFFNGNYKIIGHRAGVRPTVKDRRPFIGFHPKHEQIGIFNGLGSKGVSLGPFFAKKLVSSLLGTEELPEEVNIQRFFTFFEDPS